MKEGLSVQRADQARCLCAASGWWYSGTADGGYLFNHKPELVER